MQTLWINSFLVAAQGVAVEEEEEAGFGLINPEDSGVVAVEEEESGTEVIEGGSSEEFMEAENFVCTGTGSFGSKRSCSTYYTCTADGKVRQTKGNG